MSWTALRITPDANRDGVIAALFASGSQGIVEDGHSLVTHFPPDAELEEIRNGVLSADPRATVVMTSAPNTDYSHWRARVSAHRIGDITLSPPWLAAELDPATTVVIDPAMAFGTGEHATTQSVVLLMQNVVREGDVVADLGAGSAVLSIAAAKLGAARVAAIELDHDAIGNAEENVEVNGVAENVSIIEGDAGLLLPLVAPVGLVLANIISSILLELLPAIHSAVVPGGHAILSGILLDERSMMVDAIQRDPWRIVSEDTEDGWWSVLIERQR